MPRLPLDLLPFHVLKQKLQLSPRTNRDLRAIFRLLLSQSDQKLIDPLDISEDVKALVTEHVVFKLFKFLLLSEHRQVL